MRFNKDKVILMGHSYGSLLGASYVSRHPERVEKYIGIGQVVSSELLRLIEVGASCFNHYCVGYDDT